MCVCLRYVIGENKYFSNMFQERDLHSGLIGPLVICKSGTLKTGPNPQPDIQEFSLLFHTFDETKSWYLEENLQRHCAPPCQANTEDPWYHISNKFAGGDNEADCWRLVVINLLLLFFSISQK